ncbi:MAG: hypothetical protein K0S80_1695 [Neobacillus sp.]|nr:hypothetical protein [Neobacillus sp.]
MGNDHEEIELLRDFLILLREQKGDNYDIQDVIQDVLQFNCEK